MRSYVPGFATSYIENRTSYMGRPCLPLSSVEKAIVLLMECIFDMVGEVMKGSVRKALVLVQAQSLPSKLQVVPARYFPAYDSEFPCPIP